MPAGLSRRGHDLELGEVWAVVLTVAQLHKSIRSDGVVTVGGCRIESDTFEGQFIDITGAVPEVSLQGIPIVELM